MRGYPRATFESGHDIEFLDIAEQIEKGVKRGRIPDGEALEVLHSFYQSNSLTLPVLEDEDSPENKIITLTEDLSEKIKKSPSLVSQASQLLFELNSKYPVTEEKN